jgi:hypothetical protein
MLLIRCSSFRLASFSCMNSLLRWASAVMAASLSASALRFSSSTYPAMRELEGHLIIYNSSQARFVKGQHANRSSPTRHSPHHGAPEGRRGRGGGGVGEEGRGVAGREKRERACRGAPAIEEHTLMAKKQTTQTRNQSKRQSLALTILQYRTRRWCLGNQLDRETNTFCHDGQPVVSC